MSFRIDLTTKEGVTIYLVVINDVINVNFETNKQVDPDQHLAAEMRSRFTHLIDAHASLKYQQEMVRGEDPEHVKRHHSILEETQVMHTHYSFDQEVTPEILDHFFRQLLLGQRHPDHPDDQFVTESHVSDILRTYAQFYDDFKGSELESEFLKERELTRSEKESLVKHAKQDRTGHLSKRDLGELEKCGFTESEIPRPDKSEPRQRGIGENINDLELLIQLFGLSLRRSTMQPTFTASRTGFFQQQPTGFAGFQSGFLISKPDSNQLKREPHDDFKSKGPNPLR